MDEYIADLHEDENGLLELGEVREEIIRCRDCDHLIECMDLDDWCSRHESEVNPDGFCAWAERREDG